MSKIIVKNNGALHGSVTIAGAKNAVLALMPATLLSREPITLNNVPRLSDVDTACALLKVIGTRIDRTRNGKSITLTTPNITSHTAADSIVRKMRASILILGPLLARDGRAYVSLPGGDAIGTRPVDIHIDALSALGAKFELQNGYIKANVPDKLVGTTIYFPFASVGATENILMAATLAKGTTIIKNAAKEPEICDLADFLRAIGAKISGDGSDTIIIQGVKNLNGAQHSVIPDRIEIGTYMLAALIAGGEITCIGGRRNLLEKFCVILEKIGAEIIETDIGLICRAGNQPLKPISITTQPYPGFPTDLQAQMMALFCTIDGVSIINEHIFENRFMHAAELNRMGASITISGNKAIITGVKRLWGAPVMATDLRASMSLILAGLVASGETIVSGVHHLDRGYEQVVDKFLNIGANIKRI